MSGGKQIPDEWVEEEYPAEYIASAGEMARRILWLRDQGCIQLDAQQQRELAEMRRADVEAR